MYFRLARGARSAFVRFAHAPVRIANDFALTKNATITYRSWLFVFLIEYLTELFLHVDLWRPSFLRNKMTAS